MGADIYLWVERRTDGCRYEAVVPTRSNSADAPATARRPAGGPRQWSAHDQRWFYRRDYFEFALLDGRRCSWPFVPLIPTRGFPADLSEEVVRVLAFNDVVDPYAVTVAELSALDIGSPSWFTLEEFRAVDWAMKVPCQRRVHYTDVEWSDDSYVADLNEFAVFVADTGAYPSEWHGRPITVGDSEAIYEDCPFEGSLQTMEPVAAVAHGLRRLMDQMSEIASDPADVRAVFWFDQLAGFHEPPREERAGGSGQTGGTGCGV